MEDREWSDRDFGSMPSVLVASHELKSPLSLIRQYGLMLTDDSLAQAEIIQIGQNIVQVSESALALVSDLANVANLQPSLFPLEPVNLMSLITQLTSELTPTLEMNNRVVNWPVARNGRQLVVANRKLLNRILSNFILNSLKYSEESSAVDVSFRRVNDVMRLGVRDYGPAIDKQEYSQLLDELDKRKTLSSRPESSGLGVYVASQFAQAMGGEIGLIRHRDGLTFYVDAPLSNQLSLI